MSSGCLGVGVLEAGPEVALRKGRLSPNLNLNLKFIFFTKWSGKKHFMKFMRQNVMNICLDKWSKRQNLGKTGGIFFARKIQEGKKLGGKTVF